MNIGGQSIGQQDRQSTPIASSKPRKDKLNPEDLYAYYDRGKKSIADFVTQYQTVSNYDYYKNTRGTIDYRYKLQDLYDHIMLDLHLTSIIDSLFHQIVGERYCLEDGDGNVDEEATKLIKNSWFVDYIRGVLESKAYGYTLIELGEVNDKGTLDGIKNMPRRNFAPKNNLVLEYPTDTAGWDITAKKFKDDYPNVRKPLICNGLKELKPYKNQAEGSPRHTIVDTKKEEESEEEEPTTEPQASEVIEQ